MLITFGCRPRAKFTSRQVQQFICHVYVYAEVLFCWQLYHKRLELLKAVCKQLGVRDDAQHVIGVLFRLFWCRDERD